VLAPGDEVLFIELDQSAVIVATEPGCLGSITISRYSTGTMS